MLTLRLVPLAALVLALTAGCAKNSQTPARVSGMATYKNKPISGGTIKFHSDNLGTYQSQLGTDGTYEITDIPSGELVVTIENEALNPKKQQPTYGGKGAKQYQERMMKERQGGAAVGGDKKAAGEYVKLPTQYANPKTSPLTVTLRAGRQVKNFELTD